MCTTTPSRKPSPSSLLPICASLSVSVWAGPHSPVPFSSPGAPCEARRRAALGRVRWRQASQGVPIVDTPEHPLKVHGTPATNRDRDQVTELEAAVDMLHRWATPDAARPEHRCARANSTRSAPSTVWNGSNLAERAGRDLRGGAARPLRRFSGRGAVRNDVIEHAGSLRAVRIIDETVLLANGPPPIQLNLQYSGTAGPILARTPARPCWLLHRSHVRWETGSEAFGVRQ